MANLVSLGRRNVLYHTKQTNKKCDCVNLPTTYKNLKAWFKSWHWGKFLFHSDDFPPSDPCLCLGEQTEVISKMRVYVVEMILPKLSNPRWKIWLFLTLMTFVWRLVSPESWITHVVQLKITEDKVLVVFTSCYTVSVCFSLWEECLCPV